MLLFNCLKDVVLMVNVVYSDSTERFHFPTGLCQLSNGKAHEVMRHILCEDQFVLKACLS